MVEKKYQKQINSIYSDGRLAFKKNKDEPFSVRPEKCRLLEKQKTIMWKKAA